MIVPLLPFYVQRVAPAATLVGILSGFYATAQFFVGPMPGNLSDRFGRRPVLIACLSGTSLAYVLLAVADSLPLLALALLSGTSLAYVLLAVADSLPLLALALLIDGVTGGNLSIAQASIADSTTPERRARGLGLIGAAFGLGLMGGTAVLLNLTVIAGPVLAGVSFDMAGTTAPYLIGALLAGAALLTFTTSRA
jgi:DHA1 family tetracycline resistance protein-like MFS transporter